MKPAWLCGLLCAAMHAQTLDNYLTGLARETWAAREAALAAIRTPEQVARRQAYIRSKITASIGGLPAEKTPLNARITGTLARDGYRVEKLIFESLPRFYVTANVYVPAGAGPFPAMLGVAGHSANGKASATYQRGWISLAKRGILVLAFDPPGQGERSEYFDQDLGRSRVGIGTGEHTMTGLQCLLTGSNYARYEIWDGIRAVDYLLTRRDVDPKRLAVAGNSGGGTQTAYLAVLEPRLAVAAPSCYITSWRNLWFRPGPQDAEQDFVGFLSDGLDFSDFLIAFAPRPLKMLTAIQDFFPTEGAHYAFKEARRIYEILGAADKVAFFEYDDTHGWSKPRREATYQWMDRWLAQRDDFAGEPEFDTELDRNLEATASGQVSVSLGGETVQSLNRALGERLAASRKGHAPEALRALVRKRLAMDARPAAGEATKESEADGDGYRIERWNMGVPAVVLAPALDKGRRPAVLYLNPKGKLADAAAEGDMTALARAGFVVLAPDVRGFSANWQTSMRAMLVGKTILGIQLGDTLACFEHLVKRADVDPARVAVFGKGNGGVLALYAAALEPRIHKLASEGSVRSYLDIVKARQHEGAAAIAVPGVLHDFDLPDLVKSIAPRKVWLVEPRTPTGARASGEHYRPEGWSFEKAYAGWLKD